MGWMKSSAEHAKRLEMYRRESTDELMAHLKWKMGAACGDVVLRGETYLVETWPTYFWGKEPLYRV